MIYDALVIGGGPAGATAALVLAKTGWSVAVIEKKRFPRRKVCGEFISATSLPLLRELGIADAFLRLAGPDVRRVGLFAQDAMVAAAMPQAGGNTGLWGRALGREHLDLILLEAAVRAGADLWQPWTAVALERTREGHACTITAKAGRQKLIARIVIAADGSWERSVVRAPCAAIHGPSDLFAFKAHLVPAQPFVAERPRFALMVPHRHPGRTGPRIFAVVIAGEDRQHFGIGRVNRISGHAHRHRPHHFRSRIAARAGDQHVDD